jgi:hypothetical protein
MAILGLGVVAASAGGKEVDDVMIGRSLKVGGVRCHSMAGKEINGIEVRSRGLQIVTWPPDPSQ